MTGEFVPNPLDPADHLSDEEIQMLSEADRSEYLEWLNRKRVPE